MENDPIVAIFRNNQTMSLIGYAYLGEEFVRLTQEFPDLAFIMGYKSTFPGLEQVMRLSQATLTKNPDLRAALAMINQKERESRAPTNTAALFTKRLAEKIVEEAIKVRDKK